jgi:methionyl-tRNA formyltransferase
MACFAFGKIFGPKTLALFPKGSYNVHPSLLPRWRGCAPIPAAILAGDAETGVTVQRMALEMVSGDILAQTRFPLDGTEYASELLDRAAREGAQLIARVLDEVERGRERGTPQDSSQATFCTMLKKEDGLIDWNSGARAVSATIRAFYPWPGAYTLARAGARDGTESTLIVHRAHVVTETPRTQAIPGTVLGVDKKEGILVQTGDGVLALETLQWRTKKILDWKSFINGSRDFVGSVLGTKGQST